MFRALANRRAQQEAQQQVQKMDARRLDYFELRAGERPIETFTAWMPGAWPRGPMPLGEGRWVSEAMLDAEAFDVFLASPEGLLGDEAFAWAKRRGTVMILFLTVGVVTDRRLRWQPVPALGHSPGGGDYGTFGFPALGPRSLDLRQISFAEPLDLSGLSLPDGARATGGMVLDPEYRPSLEIDGPPWPAFAAGGFDAETAGLSMAFSLPWQADWFGRALLEAGVRLEPRGFADGIGGTREGWRPLWRR